jgi:hypothetical protein
VKQPGVEIIPAVRSSDFPVSAIIAAVCDNASEHFLEFFATTIRNKNTRVAYVQAAVQFFPLCEQYDLRLASIRPLHVSAYIESKPMTAPSIKQYPAGLRGLFNWLVVKQVVPENPALFVKGPRFSRQVGITPIMEAADAPAARFHPSNPTHQGAEEARWPRPWQIIRTRGRPNSTTGARNWLT